MSQTKAQLIDAVDGSIVTADIADDAVNADKLASNSVVSASIVDGSIVNADINASAAIAGSKISPSFTANTTITAASPVLRLADSTDPQGTNGIIGKLEFFGNDGSSGGADVRSFIQTISTNATGNAHALTIGLGESNNAPTEKVRILGDGKVGIGTTSPTTNLHVHTDANGEGVLIKSTGNTSNALTFDANRGTEGVIAAMYGRWNGTTVAQISFTSGADGTNKDDGIITFGTESAASNGNVNASEKMRLDSSGRLLIGTTASLGVFGLAAQLQIAGSTAGESSLALRRFGNSAQGAFFTFSKSRNAADGSRTIVQNGDELGRVAFCADDGTDLVTGAAEIRANVDGTPGSNDMPGRLTFFTTSDGSATLSERMRIDSSGNVGIGETTAADNRIRSTSPHAYNVVAKSSNGNGGYENFTGLTSTAAKTFYVTHNGRVGAADGIIFGSDTAAANVLDDYEEGTFSPTFGASNGSSTVSYTTQQGAYTKIGNTVFFNVYIVINSISTNTHSVIVIGNLPYTNAGNRVSIHTIRSSGFQSSGDDSRPFAGTVEANNTKVELVKATSGGTGDFTTSNSQAGSQVYISGQYPVS